MSRMRAMHSQEMESLRNEYETIIDKSRKEYTMCNETLRRASEAQCGEIHSLGRQIVDNNERHRKEKAELDEQLVRDKFRLDAVIAEQ